MNYVIGPSSESASLKPIPYPEYDPLRTDIDTDQAENQDELPYVLSPSDQATTTLEVKPWSGRAAVINEIVMQSLTSSKIPIDNYVDLIIELLAELSNEDYEYYSENPAYYQVVIAISAFQDQALNLLSDEVFKDSRDEDGAAILIDLLGKLRDNNTLALRKDLILRALRDDSNVIRHASISALGHICEKDLIVDVDFALAREDSPLLRSGLERLRTRLIKFGA